jgi:hypothetical protein
VYDIMRVKRGAVNTLWAYLAFWDRLWDTLGGEIEIEILCMRDVCIMYYLSFTLGEGIPVM